MTTPILPPATIGILGSGQLGRMLALVARQMGYRVHVFSPGTDTPTGQVADREFSADYHDKSALIEFAQTVDVITYEFENVPFASADLLNEIVPVRPKPEILRVASNRLREKSTFANAGLPVTPFRAVRSAADLDVAIAELGLPLILKTVTSGYDGKGQARLDSAENAHLLWSQMGQAELIAEKMIDFACEVSVVGARGLTGEFVAYDVIENEHRNHILDISTIPSSLSSTVKGEAVRIASEVFELLDVVGVLCIEFFVTQSADLLINEIAPRPHNSGHLTIEAAVTSQFEQQLRALCGLPLGATTLRSPAVMVNLLGDLWQNGNPAWERVTAFDDTHLHLYGKKEARIGRKMGHITTLASTPAQARTIALNARQQLATSNQQPPS